MDIRRVCRGHYSDHGLGRELTWYPDETVITTPAGDRLTVTDGGHEARVSYRPAGASRSIDLTGKAPAGIEHEVLVAYWTGRLERFTGDLQQLA